MSKSKVKNKNDSGNSFYYIKAGPSNCLIEAFVKNIDINKSIKILVGFGNISLPSKYDSKFIANKKNSNGKLKEEKDLTLLYESSSESNRKKSRYFTFTSDKIYILEPTSLLRHINKSEVGELVSFVNSKKEVKCLLLARDWNVDEIKTDTHKIIETKCVGILDRSNVLPTLSSLAVYQYFTRGTFRPLKAIGKDRSTLLETVIDTGGLQTGETVYGFFFRKYIEHAISGKNTTESNPVFFKNHFNLKSSDDLSKRQLLLSTLNPVQFEAAIALLLMDLGWVVDFFSANALDVIDISARTDDADTKKRTIKVLSAMTLCENDDLDIELKNVITNKINDDGIVQFQCKDYDHGETLLCQKSVIIIQPMIMKFTNKNKNSQVRANIGFLELYDLIKKDSKINLKNLDRWLNMISKLYFGK